MINKKSINRSNINNYDFISGAAFGKSLAINQTNSSAIKKLKKSFKKIVNDKSLDSSYLLREKTETQIVNKTISLIRKDGRKKLMSIRLLQKTFSIKKELKIGRKSLKVLEENLCNLIDNGLLSRKNIKKRKIVNAKQKNQLTGEQQKNKKLPCFFETKKLSLFKDVYLPIKEKDRNLFNQAAITSYSEEFISKLKDNLGTNDLQLKKFISFYALLFLYFESKDNNLLISCRLLKKVYKKELTNLKRNIKVFEKYEITWKKEESELKLKKSRKKKKNKN